MTSSLLPRGATPAFVDAFVAVSALLGCHDVVRTLESDVPLARALGRADSRAARGKLLAEAIERVRRELAEARTS